MKIYIERPAYSTYVGPFFSSREIALEHYRHAYRHASNAEDVAQAYVRGLMEVELDNPSEMIEPTDIGEY